MSRKKPNQKRISARKSYELRSGTKITASHAKLPNKTPAVSNRKKHSRAKKADAGDVLHCSICLNTHKYKYNMQMPCGHQFHERCIGSWVKISQSCPICRKPINEQSTLRHFHVEVTEQQHDAPDSTATNQILPNVAIVLAALIPIFGRRSLGA